MSRKLELELTYSDFVGRDAVIGVINKEVDAYWPTLAQFGGSQ